MKDITKATLWLTMLLLAGTAHAQINLSTLPGSQGFSGLGSAGGTWTDNSSLMGWYAANNNAGVVNSYTAYSAGAGGGTSSSTLYALGVSGSSERALGAAPSTTRSTALGLRLVNDTGSLFDEIQVSYDLEQWSDRGTALITLSYQKFSPGTGSLAASSGWTALSATASPLPTSAVPATGLGNTTGLLSGLSSGISNLGLQAGEELWLRWDFTKTAGENCTHGIDNVVVSVPEPSTAVLLVLGLFAVARAGISRRQA
jgi:hypothetical protein